MTRLQRKASTKPKPIPPDAPVTIAVFFPDIDTPHSARGSDEALSSDLLVTEWSLIRAGHYLMVAAPALQTTSSC